MSRSIPPTAKVPPPAPFWEQFRSWLRLGSWTGRGRGVEIRTLPADGRVLFFRRDRATFGFLSNFHPSPIVLDEESWPTVEHFYQAQKSFDPEYRQAIRDAVSPGRVKRLSASPTAPRRVSGQSWFRRFEREPRADWNDVKLGFMQVAVRAKFRQNPELAKLLLATKAAELVEDSPNDAFWGLGAAGRGTNWLGRILMDVRQELAAEMKRSPRWKFRFRRRLDA